MNSRLYTGTVAHRRDLPARNSFAYGIYLCYLDLDELDTLDGSLRRFAHNRGALVSFHDRDHGPRDGSPLRPWIDGLLARAGIDLEGGKVAILTLPRVMGGRFFPVSFWYCFHADGTCRAVLAEVQNTFRDHHNYLLHASGAPFDFSSRPRWPKAFYVSPFVSVAGVEHVFAFTPPGERMSVTVNDEAGSQLVLTTTLSLAAGPLTDAALTRAVLTMGPASARALVLIHWQALKLLAKRVPFFAHVPPTGEETSL